MMRLKLSLMLILLAFVFPLSAVQANADDNQKQSPNSSPGDGGEQKQPSHNEQEPTQQSGPTTNQQASASIQQDPTKDKPSKSSEHECGPLPSGSCAEWAEVLATILAAGAALYSLKLLGDQVTANKDAARAAKDNAAAALEEARAITLSERAYVFAKVEFTEVINSSHEGNVSTMARALFINLGKTPAIIMSMSGSYSFVEPAGIHAITVADTDENYPDGWVIAGGDKFQLPIPIFITHNQMEMLKEGRVRLCCSGRIKYKDIFEREWVTGYCWEYLIRHHRFTFCDEATRLNYCCEYKREDTKPPSGV